MQDDNEKYTQIPVFGYRKLLEENPDLQKSFVTQDPKVEIKKAKRLKLITIGTAIIIGMNGIAAAIRGLAKNVKEMKTDLSRAHEYSSEVIMPQVLEITDCKSKDDETKYAFDNSKEEYNTVVKTLSEALNISPYTASYMLFEYCDYDEELFQNLGYKSAEAWAKDNDFIPSDSWDGTCVTCFQNMNEANFVEAVDNYKEAAEELNTDNIYDVKTYLDLNKESRTGR